MNIDSLIGKKVYFGKYGWKIIDWTPYGCLLICDVLGGDSLFLQSWDRTYRLDIGEEVIWPKCELYDWLNDDFLKSSFSEEEAACIVNEASSIYNFKSEQVGVFLLERSELIKHTNIHIDNCWTLDADVWDCYEETIVNKKYVQPVIWIDFALIDSLIPGWKELATALAYSDDNDFGIPNPIQLYQSITGNYNLVIEVLLEKLRCASENARKYFYKQIYEVLYYMARNDDAVSINRIFELCPDIETEGYYSYEQMLPLGEAIENEAYNAICALVDNGCDIDIASWNSSSTIDIASRLKNPEQMLLFLLSKGCSLSFEDAFYFWSENLEFAKELIKKAKRFNTESGKLDGFLMSIDFELSSEEDENVILRLEQMREFIQSVLL